MTDYPYRMHLAKEDFKFSSAHFTLFPGEDTELLHGHNYQIQVELAGVELDEWGLLCDIGQAKKIIRALCAAWDSRTLVPEESPHLKLTRHEDGLEVRYQERHYRFPWGDVVLLPLANTSIELMARYLWGEIVRQLDAPAIREVAVTVGETAGQSCRYCARLKR